MYQTHIFNRTLITVEPVYYGHLGTTHQCPVYQIFHVSSYDKATFGTVTKRVDYEGVPIFKCPDYQV